MLFCFVVCVVKALSCDVARPLDAEEWRCCCSTSLLEWQCTVGQFQPPSSADRAWASHSPHLPENEIGEDTVGRSGKKDKGICMRILHWVTTVIYFIWQGESEHCLLLALPCGRDASDVHTQTHALKNNLINYLIQKQAAGIINIQGQVWTLISIPIPLLFLLPVVCVSQGGSQNGYVLHIFPPCPFSQSHLSRVAPDLLSSASANCHLMIVVATM